MTPPASSPHAFAQSHTVWDRDLEPLATVRPGEELELSVVECSGGSITPDSTSPDLLSLDFSRINPVVGPFAVEGARPGDALVVDVLGIDVDSWGWTASIPGFGLLADSFPDPHLRVSTVERDGQGGGSVRFGGTDVVLPAVPMIGTIGVAPPEPGPHAMVPPRRWGGNLDIRDVGVGARLVLPVGVEGALFSCGDTHAAMADGEVCGTGVEISSTVRVRLSLLPGRAPTSPVLVTDPRSLRTEASVVVTGIGPDLYEGCRDAVRQAVELLVAERGLSREDAYLLLSLVGDLRVAEVVDMPNWVVACHVPASLVPGYPTAP